MNDILASTVISTFNKKYKEIVRNIIRIRNEAGFTQQYIAEWIEVDRRKIIEFERGEKYDIDLLLKICDKFSIDLELNFKID